MKNSEYLDFSDHLGHGLTENKRQNLYTFGERTRAAQPGLLCSELNLFNNYNNVPVEK